MHKNIIIVIFIYQITICEVWGTPAHYIRSPFTSVICHCVYISTVTMFDDNAKCSSHITTSLEDCHYLLDNMCNWSASNHLHFNTSNSKCTLLSFNSKLNTSVQIDDNALPTIDHHCNLGVIISTDLPWNKYELAYRSLCFLCHTLSVTLTLYQQRNSYTLV